MAKILTGYDTARLIGIASETYAKKQISELGFYDTNTVTRYDSQLTEYEGQPALIVEDTTYIPEIFKNKLIEIEDATQEPIIEG